MDEKGEMPASKVDKETQEIKKVPPANEGSDTLFGTTFDGKRFKIPKTTNMIASLFGPDLKTKTMFDYIILSVIGLHIYIFFTFSAFWRGTTLTALFFFWRTCYNVGLGVLLRWQSQRQGLVATLKKYGWKSTDNGGIIGRWLRREVEYKMGNDYNFSEIPIDFSVWLVFRQLVDMILVCDFVAYALLALSCLGSASVKAELWQLVLRNIGGWTLVFFNLWVKINAHKVVKDYAWYWGDFFFKVEQWLIFDGVFEMAPHPMYSIGYAGYYGVSLITGSYTVFFVSIAAHIMQFMFLTFVENPHIEKIYEKPAVLDEVVRINKERRGSSSNAKTEKEEGRMNEELLSDGVLDKNQLLGLSNFELFRPVDMLLILLIYYSFIVPLAFSFVFKPKEEVHYHILVFSVINCAVWILIRTLGISVLFYKQSTSQWWTKWFIKRGKGVNQSFKYWKSLYNVCVVMTILSFAQVAIVAYKWTGGTQLSLYKYNSEQLAHTMFRHIIGMVLISLQVWCASSVYQAIGEYGWYYGDFFIPQSDNTNKLYYTGIYRYLNNPEKVIGQAAYFGLSIMSGSWTVFTLALSLQILLMVFYEFIEGPHMKKLYGQQIRVDSGITKTIKKAINENSLAKLIVYDFPKRMGSNQDMSTLAGFGSGSHSQDNKDVGGDFNVSNLVKPLFDVKKPLKEMVNETRAFIGSTSRRLAQNIIPPSLKGIKNLELYKFELVNSRKDKDMRNSEPSDSKIVYELGEPITIRWEAPVTHLRNDWVGIYPVTSNPSPAITTVPSKGQYVYVHPDEKLMSGFVQGDCMFTGACDGLRDAKSEHEVSSSHKLDSAEDSVASTGKKEVYYGSAVFSGNSLPWKAGTYEMRYHHGESHNVIAISPAFEISASLNDLQYDQSDLKALTSKLFLKILNRCTSVTVTINVDDLDSSPILKYKSFFDSSSDSLPIKPAHIDEDSHESQILESNGGANSKALFLDNPRWRSKVIEPMKELSDPIGISGSLEPSVAKRLAYCISAYFKIGYSSEVLTKAAKNNLSAATIADHIYNSKLALESFSKNQADSLAILE